tara:strand:+ start:637 stop:1560 length:924 start_codon:yes stop_codon:yes gene_type:complete
MPNTREPSCCPDSMGPGTTRCEFIPGIQGWDESGGYQHEGIHAYINNCHPNALPHPGFLFYGACDGSSGCHLDYNNCNPEEWPYTDCCDGVCGEYGHGCTQSFEIDCVCQDDCSGGFSGEPHFEPGPGGPGGYIDPNEIGGQGFSTTPPRQQSSFKNSKLPIATPPPGFNPNKKYKKRDNLISRVPKGEGYLTQDLIQKEIEVNFSTIDGKKKLNMIGITNAIHNEAYDFIKKSKQRKSKPYHKKQIEDIFYSSDNMTKVGRALCNYFDIKPTDDSGHTEDYIMMHPVAVKYLIVFAIVVALLILFF